MHGIKSIHKSPPPPPPPPAIGSTHLIIECSLNVVSIDSLTRIDGITVERERNHWTRETTVLATQGYILTLLQT